MINRMRDAADMIHQRFAKALKRYGLCKSGRLVQLDCTLFRKPRSIPVNVTSTDDQLDFLVSYKR